ncbi:MAG: glycosyl transferase [Syntrophus sp. (in: bacteria)]|nr:glycosyl transferase [Syntrophus sp. (in: bacteria)]
MPKFSIIIPVLHEEETINNTINHIYGTNREVAFEIIVADGSPYGRTLEVIQNETAVKVRSLPGRGAQLNAGALRARGETLLFLHADTKLPDRALSLISAVMADSRYVAGTFDLGIDSIKTVFRMIETVASFRSRFTRIPYGDQAIFVRREYFRKAGGFREIAIMEDVEFMRRMRKRGDKIIIIPEKVLTSPRRWEKEGILYCTLRNWLLILLYFIGISPERLARFYKNEVSRDVK